jgi:MFS family permease
MLSMIMVGFASNIWLALAGRAIGGFLNGNIGVIQTMVAELVTKPEHEPRAYSVMPSYGPVARLSGLLLVAALPIRHLRFPIPFLPMAFSGSFPTYSRICSAQASSLLAS